MFNTDPKQDNTCAICYKELSVKFKRVKYNGKEKWICETHPCPKLDK